MKLFAQAPLYRHRREGTSVQAPLRRHSRALVCEWFAQIDGFATRKASSLHHASISKKHAKWVCTGPAQGPHRAHTGPAQGPHRARWENARFCVVHKNPLGEVRLLLWATRKIVCFYSGPCAGPVRALYLPHRNTAPCASVALSTRCDHASALAPSASGGLLSKLKSRTVCQPWPPQSPFLFC